MVLIYDGNVFFQRSVLAEASELAMWSSVCKKNLCSWINEVRCSVTVAVVAKYFSTWTCADTLYFFYAVDAKISVASVGAKGCQNLAGLDLISCFQLSGRAPSSLCCVIWEFILPSKLWSNVCLSGFFILFNLLSVHWTRRNICVMFVMHYMG